MSQKTPTVRARIEKWSPHFWALLSTVGIWLANHYWLCCPPQKLGELLSSLINVLGVALAFVSACQAIILSLSERPFVVKLKEIGVYTQLHDYFRAAIFWCAIGLALSCALVVLDGGPCGVWGTRVIRSIWLYSILAAAFTSLRVTRLFGTIVKLTA